MIWAACAVLVLLAGIYILMPLLREPRQDLQVELMAETEFDRLLDRRAVVYGNLSDLEFEYKMGRLSDSDYKQLGARYENEAAGILQRLDKLSASENLDGAIEKEIAAHKAGPASGKKPAQQPPLCPSCGAEVLAGKKYCADCGCRL